MVMYNISYPIYPEKFLKILKNMLFCCAFVPSSVR